MPKTLKDYQRILENMMTMMPFERTPMMRHFMRTDLFFLLWYGCGRKDMEHQWLIDRCHEVSEHPNGYLDLWAREHYKSTIITFGLTIQDILASHGNDPLPTWQGLEPTFGFFSHTRPIAKGFLRQVKREFESNGLLKLLFPDIIWDNPHKDAPKWALDIDTPVLTTNGWKKHGDLQVGDEVFGSNGQPIKVIGVSSHMEDKECRRVVFDDCEFVASSEHLWTLEHKTKSWKKWDDGKNLVTVQTDDLPVGDKSYRMLPTPIIDFPEKRLPLAPYILGLWLGDGTINSNVISMHRDDEGETLRLIDNSGFSYYVHRRHDEDNFSMYGIKGLKEKLTQLGCISQKHIPAPYFLSSKEQRLALLQGLMDSDGTCKKPTKHRCAGMCMFSNTSKQLADGVYYLAASLGMRPSMIDFMPKSRARKRIYQVYFVGVKSHSPFRLERKKQYLKDSRTKTARYLRAVESTSQKTVNCIKVDAKDSLYLAGLNLVPTHNSEDDGLVLKRRSNPKESTLEAWGLVEGQPTSKHFDVMVYDDVVTLTSVYTPDMMRKTVEAWEMSINLGAGDKPKRRYIGTRYHFNDCYKTMMDRQAAVPRIYAATDDGTPDGAPVLKSVEKMAELRRILGPYTFSTQQLLNPVADERQGMKREWVNFHDGVEADGLNVYIVADPASAKKSSSDYTAMWVIGLGSDNNFYVLDMIRDRFNLVERTDTLFRLHRKYRPLGVGYEKFGMMADVEYIKERMQREAYHFQITELGGSVPKYDRIRMLIPSLSEGRWYFPKQLMRTTYDGRVIDIVDVYINEELMAFPVPVHDDMLDAQARILDPTLKAIWPRIADENRHADRYARRTRQQRGGSSWAV